MSGPAVDAVRIPAPYGKIWAATDGHDGRFHLVPSAGGGLWSVCGLRLAWDTYIAGVPRARCCRSCLAIMVAHELIAAAAVAADADGVDPAAFRAQIDQVQAGAAETREEQSTADSTRPNNPKGETSNGRQVDIR